MLHTPPIRTNLLEVVPWVHFEFCSGYSFCIPATFMPTLGTSPTSPVGTEVHQKEPVVASSQQPAPPKPTKWTTEEQWSMLHERPPKSGGGEGIRHLRLRLMLKLLCEMISQ